MKRALIIATAALMAAFAAFAQDAVAKPKYTELYYQRASLFDALGVDSTDIVFLGNSLTHGCEWHELLDMPNVLNRGINGDIVEGVGDRISSVVNGHPAKIFLMIGANDVSHDLSADSIVRAVTKLIDYITEATPSTRLYIQSMLPINNSFGRYRLMKGKEQVIRDINAALEPEVRRRGLTWVNLHPAFCDADGNLRAEFTNDGLHLLAPGYLTWRDIVLPYVKE
ncbi:MAG: sialate O-acetylesterase [Muribaculaceae bacterium]|nr:sialate O-acetylesterase [Muribaculaceae bacterium]